MVTSGKGSFLQRNVLLVRAIDEETHWVVKGDRIDDDKATKVVLVRVIVAMPTNHIKGGVVLQQKLCTSFSRLCFYLYLLGSKECSLELGDDSIAIFTHFSIFIPRHRAQEVTRVC